MKKTLCTLIALCSLSGLQAKKIELGKNPVLPEFHADPEVMYSQKTGRYYIYSTTDGARGWGGYYFTVFSSKDLKSDTTSPCSPRKTSSAGSTKASCSTWRRIRCPGP